MKKEKFISSFDKLKQDKVDSIVSEMDEILDKATYPYSRDDVIKENSNLRSVIKLMEEMAELTQALSKYLYKGDEVRWNLIEEMADVYLLMEIVKKTLKITPEEDARAKAVKLKRYREKLLPKIEEDKSKRDKLQDTVDAAVEKQIKAILNIGEKVLKDMVTNAASSIIEEEKATKEAKDVFDKLFDEDEPDKIEK